MSMRVRAAVGVAVLAAAGVGIAAAQRGGGGLTVTRLVTDARDAKLVNALYGRGLAKLRRGQTSSGEEDIAGAKALRIDIAEEFARYGVQ